MLDNEEDDEEAVEGTVGIDPLEFILSCITDKSLNEVGSSGMPSKKCTDKDERPMEDDLLRMLPSGDLLSALLWSRVGAEKEPCLRSLDSEILSGLLSMISSASVVLSAVPSPPRK